MTGPLSAGLKAFFILEAFAVIFLSSSRFFVFFFIARDKTRLPSLSRRFPSFRLKTYTFERRHD